MARNVRPDEGTVATPTARFARRCAGTDHEQDVTGGAAPKTRGRRHREAGAARRCSRDEDLVLHLPLRYEDHTRVTPLAALRSGETVQTEGVVVNTDIQYRPRRQLVCLIGRRDGGATGAARAALFSFYPSMQKALATGHRVRVFGDVRDGHFGLEIVHPQFKVIAPDTPLPDRLTPVYPTTAGLSQETLRKVIARALAVDPARTSEVIPEEFTRRRKLWKFGDAVHFLHTPPPRLSPLTQKALDARTHPAWARLKFDELLAQQLSLKAHRKARALRRAPVLTGSGKLTVQLIGRAYVQADAGAATRVARDQPRPQARDADAAAAAGRRRLRQDDRRGAGRAAGDRKRQAGRVHGADRNPGRAALPQARRRGSTDSACRHRVAVGLVTGARRVERAADGWRAASRHSPSARMRCFRKASRCRISGFAIVDEQHRFGVAQRLALRGKGLAEAHQLMMSATPIPRTLAMTFYADLDVSVLDEMPPGRTPVATRLVNQKRRAEIVEWVGKCCAGRAAGVLGVSADRGVRKARAADGGRAARRARPRRCRSGCASG